MTQNETIRLLIINDSRSEAERLISMLHNAGRPNRAQHVDSEEALVKLLQDQAWDLLIAHDRAACVTPAVAIQQIRRLSKDVPVLLLSDEEGSQAVVEGMKSGAVDVIRVDEDQHLLLVISREMQNREHRQQRRQADRRLKEAERRSQQLLDNSRDAIAYVQDGLYLYANRSFSELFGYGSVDDIDCMPVIDMVSKPDQAKLKSFLKDFAIKGEDAELTQISFTGLNADGSAQALTIHVANAIFDEEPCIQFCIPSAQESDNEELVAALQEMKDRDQTSGLFSRKYLIEQLELAIDTATHQQRQSALLQIGFKTFENLVQSTVGLASMDEVVKNLGEFLQTHCASDDVVARISDDTYMVLVPNTNAQAAQKKAEQLAAALTSHIVEVNQKTLQLTPVIGLALINETAATTQSILDEAVQATATANDMEDSGGYLISLYEPSLEKGRFTDSDIAKAVQSALDNNRFRLLFQPVINLRGSEEELYEVLLRMLNNDGIEIFPQEFFSAANRTGCSLKIDRWVILEAVRVLAEHRAKGNKTRLLINLSQHSLCDEGLPAWIGVVFKAADLCPDSVIFQCQEADITKYLNAANKFFSALNKLGCKVSISHFGCALNPFNTLKHLPSDFIKVDGSFTQDIQNGNEGEATLKKLLAQLHEADKVTIVPFVEQASVLSTLWQAGAHFIQGHYLQGPSAEMSYEFTLDN